MTGTFGSLNTALIALQYQRAAMDTASNNIANTSTEGYVRRRLEAQSLGGTTSALWSRYDANTGDGVKVSGVNRMTDALLDARSRTEHGKQSYLDTRLDALDRIEGGVAEPSDTGLSAALSAYRSAWQDLESHPDQGSVRQAVLAAGQRVADALHTQASNVAAEQTTQRGALVDSVTDANSVAKDLAAVNKSIAEARAAGLDASDLLDQRDLLGSKLATLTGGVASVRSDGGLDVTVAGQPLVTGRDSFSITITGGVAPDGSDPGTPLGIAVGGTPVTVAAVGGSIGAEGELLTTTLPGLTSQLDAVARELADSVNAVHITGYDQDGTAATAFFSYDPAHAAASLAVAIADPRKVAASAQPGGGLGTGIAERLGDPGTAEAAWTRVVNGFATDVASAKRQSTTQQLLTGQIDTSREQLSGVNYDEETVNLVAAQHGYEAAARVMSTLDSVLDTLINRMGVG